MRNLGKWVLASAVAFVCISAQTASKQNDQEIAMTKCTRDQSSDEMSSCSGGSCSSCEESRDPCALPKEKKPRKSAAKCAVEGE